VWAGFRIGVPSFGLPRDTLYGVKGSMGRSWLERGGLAALVLLGFFWSHWGLHGACGPDSGAVLRLRVFPREFFFSLDVMDARESVQFPPGSVTPL
jgi:hypothetical protein